jgi:hypothetical protein
MTPRKPIVNDPFKVTIEGGQFDIIAEELKDRPNYVVLRRWDRTAGNYKRRKVGTIELRDARGKVLDSAKARVREEAFRWYMEVTGQMPSESPTPKTDAPFTIGQTWAAISHPESGKYPHKTPFRFELEKALEFASAKWGADNAWSSINDDRWTALVRARLDDLVKRQKQGIRATEITVSRLITAARWLRKTKRIPADAGFPPEDWKKDLVAYWKGLVGSAVDPKPDRPRFTLDETRAILAKSWEIDPRLALALALGAELRLGQVVRARRSHLVIGTRPVPNAKAGEPAEPDVMIEVEYGEFTVYGSGHKAGEVVYLTAGQIAATKRALGGYLKPLEEKYLVDSTRDYLLFPGGRLLRHRKHKRAEFCEPRLGKGIDLEVHASEEWIGQAFRRVTDACGIDYLKGRGAYGLRRALVDASLAENISEHGLKAQGGWRSGEVPRGIYADQQNRIGREEARDVRAKIRGET